MLDAPQKYGTITRALHWGMALLFTAQFAAALAHLLLDRSHPLRETLWSYHVPLGTLLFFLFFFRGAWGLINLNKHGKAQTLAEKSAKAGHALLYIFMLLVPGSRLLSSAGSTRGLDVFGFQLVAPQQETIGWTQSLANYHGEMGWILFILILGHIAMALYHHFIKKDDALRKML